ncbi:MAG: hypothetical protein WC916_06605 [Candidatus Woesearchaeota archaeon]
MSTPKNTDRRSEKLFSVESMDCEDIRTKLYERFSTLGMQYIFNDIIPLQYNAQLMMFTGGWSNKTLHNKILVIELAALTLQHNGSANTHRTSEITPHTTPFYIAGMHYSKKSLIAGAQVNKDTKIIIPAKVCICDIVKYEVLTAYRY